MRSKAEGFLGPDKIDQDGEIFDYIRELHEYLWLFVRCEIPSAQGKLDDYLGIASELARKRAAERLEK